jgi:hypothetical protein
MGNGFPRMVEHNGVSYIVLEQPAGSEGVHSILRADGEPTSALDVAVVHTMLMNEEIAKLDVPWRDY